MKNYKSNIYDYIDAEFLEEETYKLGDEIGFLPAEEIEANFCTLETIVADGNHFNIILAIENEWTGERYKQGYQVKQGSKVEMNLLLPNLVCFLPPMRIPALAEITNISPGSLSIKAVGILEDYAADMDKKAAELKVKP